MLKLDEDKMAVLKLHGYRFLFYPADIVEVFDPDDEEGTWGHMMGTWNLPNHVEILFDREFGDGQ